MTTRRSTKRIAGTLALVGLALLAVPSRGRATVAAADAFGPLSDGARHTRSSAALVELLPVGWLRRWNQIAIDASGLDHTPVAPGENRVFGENLGPGRASRAMAIVHIAMFEAVNAIAGKYRSYVGLGRARVGTSVKAAIAQAGHDTLVALFPSQAVAFDARLAEDLDRILDRRGKVDGIDLGHRAAAAILALR